jgi:hypothetical protein
MDKWKSDATKALYASKMATMKAWFRAHPELGAITADGELVVPVSKDSLIAFLGAVTDYEEAAGGSADSSAGQKRKKPLALSTVQGYGSALKAYLNEQGCKLSADVEIELSRFVGGYKRATAQYKKEGILEPTEGKDHLTLMGYRLLCQKFLKLHPTTRGASDGSSQEPEGQWYAGIFAHAFLCLMWNLIDRSVTVADILLEHISWQDDSLVVTIPMHKGDQEGSRCNSKHVYANPTQPEICPILALALHAFTHSQNKSAQLFEGTFQETRFSHLFQKLLTVLNEEDKRVLGAVSGNFGTHSSRKGAPSYALSLVDGPNPAQV